jgi:hypothetical protein
MVIHINVDIWKKIAFEGRRTGPSHKGHVADGEHYHHHHCGHIEADFENGFLRLTQY